MMVAVEASTTDENPREAVTVRQDPTLPAQGIGRPAFQATDILPAQLVKRPNG
jgi:hypothetical protein